jgi:hypothetical protein
LCTGRLGEREHRAFAVFGVELFGPRIRPRPHARASRFTLAPLSVLDARSGEWQERKAA